MFTLRLFCILSLLIISFTSYSQASGDFRTSGANTSWNNIASWERYNGSAWLAATTGQIPGTTGNLGNVTIQDGHTINHDVTFAGAITSLTVGQGTSGTLNIGAFVFNVGGATTIAANASVTVTSATGLKTFTGDFTNNGTWNNSGNSAITFAGSITNNNSFASGTGSNTLSGATKTINGTISFTSMNLTGSYTNNGTLTLVTTLIGAGTLTNSAAGVLNSSVATFTSTLNATASGNIVNYQGTSPNVKGTTYHTLNVGVSGTATATVAAVNVNANLAVTSGIFSYAALALTVTGTTSISGGATLSGTGACVFTGDVTNGGTFTKGSGTVTIAGNLTNNGTLTSGAGVYTFSGSSKSITTTNSSALTIQNATFTGSYNISSNFGSGNTFNVSTATVLSVAASAVTNNGYFSTPSLTLTNAASTFVNNGNATVTTTFGGSTSAVFTNAANSTLNNGATTTNPIIVASAVPNTVNYNRNNTQTIRGGSLFYYNLNVLGGAFTKTLGGTIEVLNVLDISGTSIFADGGFLITAGGSVVTNVGANSGYTTTRTATPWFTSIINIDNSSTITFASTTATSFTNSIPSTYGNLVFSGSNTKTLPASFPITVNGNLTLTSTTVADNGNTITVLGNIASTGTQSGAGKVLLTSGSSAHGMQGSGWNKVELDDAFGANLTAALTIGTQTTGNFTLTNGVVSLNAFNFTISNVNAAGFSCPSPSVSTMMLQNASGTFVRNIANSSLPITYVFPIGESTGTTEYSPVSMTITANATISTMSFTITDAQHPNDMNTANFTSRYWTVATALNSFSYNASFGYTAADINGTESSFDVYLYDPSALTWELIPATSASGTSTYDGTDGTFSSGNIFMVKAAINIPSTVTIDGVGGSAGVYPTLTGTTGFFNAVNQGVITSNVVVNVTATPITETGAIALFQTFETGAGAGTYTITIQSNNSTQKVFTSTYSNSTEIGTIRLKGADRVTFNGGTGTDRRLLFRNTDTGINGVVIHLLNDATNNQINNCTIEGSITSTTLGLIHIGTSTISGNGNDNNTITNNDIRQNGSSTPGIGFSSSGFSASVTNDNNYITSNNFANIYRTSSTVAAIFLNLNNTTYHIDGNRIYQESNRTGAITADMYGIFINSSTNIGIDITNNIIGYGASNGTGTTSIVSTGAVRYNCIYVTASSLGGSPVCNITGNEINNITLGTTSGGNITTPVFSGIYLNGSKYLVDDNDIGSTSGAPTILVTTSTSLSATTAMAAIHCNSTAAGQTVSNNHIGGVSLALSTGTLAMNMNGIRIATGTVLVEGNYIGNGSANSYILSNPGTGAAINSAIACASAPSYLPIIRGNVIQNITSSGSGTSSSVFGINASGGASVTIENNIIHDLNTNSTSTTSGATSSVVGIYSNATSTAFNTITNNQIYACTNTSAANSVVTGIVCSAVTGVSSLSKNLIYNIRSGTGTASVVTGIHILTGAITVSNNMVRLGYDATGAAITNSSIFTGILKDNTSANNLYYYNSVYIGGTGVTSTANNTYAFRRLQTGANDNVRNNIFFNARSNASTGGKHYAVYLNNTTTLTEDYNILFVNGTGGTFAFNGTTDQTTMMAWRANTPYDDNSANANPQFINPTSTTPDLNLNTTVPTPAESGAATIAGLTDDRSALNVRTGYPQALQSNGGGTAPDIGADESDLQAQDVLGPIITVGSIPPINAACGSTQTVTITATVTDLASGVAQGSLSPQLWWRLSSGTFASMSPTSVTGDVYSYDLVLTGVAALQTYHYYIAAQDSASTPNISYSHFNATSPIHSSVTATPSPINGAPGTFTILSTVPLSGSVNVGSGQVYTSLNANASTGLFFALNTNGLSGDLTVNVTSNLVEDGLYYPLTSITEFCGTNYTVTIQPSTNASRTITQAAGGNPLINLQGCTRVVFDGSSGGSGRYLTFASRQNTPTFYLNGNTSNITIKNCVIEGNNQLTNSVGPGVINMAGLLGTGSSINNILIDNNIIRNRSDLSQTASNCPSVLINGGSVLGLYNATNLPIKENITISNNEMHSFRQSAINFSQNLSGNGIGNNIAITGNKIYSPITQGQYQYVVYLEGGGNSIGHTISNNQIGGSALPAPDISGTWINSLSDGEVWAIYVNSGGVDPGEETIIHNNKISNFNVAGTGWSNFLGIRVEYGRTHVTNNLIGSLSASLSSPNIVCAGNGDVGVSDNSTIMGIWTQSTEEVLIDSNTVCGVQGTGGFASMDCIAHGSNGMFNGLSYQTPGSKATITNNRVMYNRCASQLQSLIISPEAFMGIFCWTDAEDNVIANNKVYNCGSGTSIWNKNVRIHGLFVGVNGSNTAQTGVVKNNEISYLFNENPGDNTSSTTRNPIIYGITIANGDWTIANNTIYLNNGSLGGSVITNTNTSIRALNDAMLYDVANCAARYYHNTVYVSGSNTTGAGTANSTYAFLRFPLDYNLTAITAGAPIELRNNIFINDRGGQGNHRALGNYASFNTDAAINWSNTASDYNLLSGPSLSNVALWGASGTYTLANFQTLSGNGDLNSDAVLTTTGSSDATHINPSELFENLAPLSQADLRIDTSPPSAPYPYNFVDGQGTPIAEVPTDIDGTTRSVTIPTLGAYEMNPCATPTITLGTIDPVCYSASSQTVNLTYSATTNSPDQYSIDWNSAANTAGFADSVLVVLPSSPIIITVPASASATTYNGTLTVRNSTSTCVSGSYAISVTINAAPTITLGSNPSVCFSGSGQNASLSFSATTGSPNQYSINTWSGGSFSNVVNASLPSSPILIAVPAGTAAGTYTASLSVRNSTTTCASATYSISVTVEDAPAITVYSPGPTSASFTNNICAGSNTAFGVTATGAGLSYQWQVSTNSGSSWSTTGLSTSPYSGSTTATLSISNVPAGLNGNLYRVIVSGNCAPPDTSAAGTLNVGAVSIGSNPPSSTVVCESANTSIAVGATGNNLTFQWQISTNSGGSWTALSNDATYSGVAGSTLSITSAQLSMNNYQYRVIVGTTSCSAQTSTASTLTVNPLPASAGSITGSASVCQNQNAVSYSVGTIANASGYNWVLPSGASIATGSNTSSITVDFSGAAVSGNITVNGTNGCGSGASSAAFAVTVNPASTPSVSIAASPDFVICSSVNVTFTATPVNGGSTPIYQWKLNGSNVGTNSSSYANATLNNGDEVICEMTSNAPCASPTVVTSNMISMTVLNSNTPTVAIVANTGAVICSGASVTFNATNQFGGNAPAYQWKLNGSNVGTNSSAYTNNALNNGDVVTVEMTSNASCISTSTATSNSIIMSVLNNVTPSVSINTLPSTTECEGNTVDFTAIPVNGGVNPSYQWKVNGNNVGANSNQYASFVLQNNDQITVVMTSEAACAITPTATSSAVTMTIIPAPNVDAGNAMTTCGTGAYVFSNGASVSNASSYSWSENGAGSITSGINTLTPTYTPAAGDLGNVVTFTLLGNGNGSCDAVLDEVTLTVTNYTSYYTDADGDGFGDPASTPVLSCIPVSGKVANNTDCCDTNADINPATEWWADQDGDGFGSYVYETGCISGCTIPAQLYPYYPLVHGGVPYVVDCNDSYANAYPGSIELCGNLVDDDCDGSTDEGCSGIPNDVWTNAQTLNTSSSNAQYPNCYLTTGTVVNADISAQGNPANVAPGAGRDVWYRFMAVSTAAQIKVQPNGFNAVIELQNSSAMQLDVENVNSAISGAEIMNFGNLTIGQIYFVGVRNYDNNAGGTFTICVSSLMPSGCATVVPSGGLSLCVNYKALYKAATSYTFNFTGTGGSAPLVTTTGTSTGLIALTTPSLGVRYGGVYNVRVDANYSLMNGLGVTEPTITVLGSTSTTNCTNVSMIQHPLVEVKSTHRCPAVLVRNSYLIGTPVVGAESVCGAISYTFEFTAMSSCTGTPNGLPFTATSTTNTPYMSLLQAFPTPTYPMSSTGYWKVRIRPNFSYGVGNYGPAQNIAINGTASAMGLMQEGMAEAEKSLNQEMESLIYPNPNSGEMMNLFLTNISDKTVHVRVLDALGKLIEQRQFTVDGTLNTSIMFDQTLRAGIYMIEFNYDNKIVNERFVVE